jgi:hypothetical protein
MFNFRNKLTSQRGAMFGLDARVALAIFAGLSAIAGTAVFSAVRDTRVTGVLTEFDNISKGYINFVFDTGVDVVKDTDPANPNTTGTPGFQNLYKDANSTLNWNGPYITIATNDHPAGYGKFALADGRIDSNWAPTTFDITTGILGKWLTLSAVPCEIAGDLERKIDGTGGAGNTGNFRYNDGCAAGANVMVSYLLSRLR